MITIEGENVRRARELNEVYDRLTISHNRQLVAMAWVAICIGFAAGYLFSLAIEIGAAQ